MQPMLCDAPDILRVANDGFGRGVPRRRVVVTRVRKHNIFLKMDQHPEPLEIGNMGRLYRRRTHMTG